MRLFAFIIACAVAGIMVGTLITKFADNKEYVAALSAKIEAIKAQTIVTHEKIYCTHPDSKSEIWWSAREYLAANSPKSLDCSFIKDGVKND